LTNVRGSKLRIQRKTVISDAEFEQLLNRAAQIKNVFLRLRSLAVLCLLRLTGKRRTEIAMLERDSFKISKGMLHITFTLLKKRKGTILTKQSTKSIPLSDPLTKPIIDYLGYLQGLKTTPKYFVPRVIPVFGHNIIQTNTHISGRQVFNLIRDISEDIWPHLFRETVAADVIKQDSSIIGAFKVQRRLDLEDFRTGFNYLRRFASDVIQREIQKVRQNAGGYHT
jgi:integrase